LLQQHGNGIAADEGEAHAAEAVLHRLRNPAPDNSSQQCATTSKDNVTTSRD